MTNQELLRQLMAFQEAIKADRYDELTRKAYSDFLEENGLDDEALEQRKWTRERQEALDFVEGFANDCKETPESILEMCRDHALTGEVPCLSTDTPYVAQDEASLERLWECYELLTGNEVSERVDRSSPFFRCAC